MTRRKETTERLANAFLGLDDLGRETLDLCASEIACAVADAWAVLMGPVHSFHEVRHAVGPDAVSALDALELVTRPSAMRKVRP